MADNNHVVFPRKLLRKFIQLYKELDCLWDRKSLLYKNRKKRHEAITRLTELVQEYEPTATRVHILRKIESLRACMRREHKKVLDSRSRVDSVDVYTPHLWYYDLLAFVVGEECEAESSDESADEPVPTCVSIFKRLQNKKEVLNSIEIEDDGNDAVQEDSYETQNYQRYNQSVVEVSESIQKPYLNFDEDKAKRHCTGVDDEYDAIGINVAAKLRGLPANMRILAEKLINDVLFQAQMNNLSNSTTISTPDPFKQDPL